MNSRRRWGCGLLAGMLVAGGCQSAKHATTQPKAVEGPAKSADDDARWKVDTRPTAEQLIAKRAQEYASTLDAGPSIDASTVTFPPPKKRTVTIPLDDGDPSETPRPNPVAGSATLLDTTHPVLFPTGPSATLRRSPQNRLGAVAGDMKSPSAESVDARNQHAQVAALRQAALNLNDGPRIEPEAADFATAARPAPFSKTDPLDYRLHKRARENPRDIAAELDLQLYAMLKDEPTPELAMVGMLPHDDREMIRTLMDGLGDFRSAVREDETMLQAKKIHPLLEMADRLRSQADLSVPTVALCRRVEGFGKYEPITPARFSAGRDSKVIVYCEVENFESKKLDGEMWETRLTQQVTIFTDNGQFVWTDKARPVVDQSRRRRHDFYAYEMLHLPADLTIGRYLLKVSITDENAGKVAEETVPVSIAATQANSAN